jgi:alkylation response protein AidB-like acyl-CoA dehydrogenase
MLNVTRMYNAIASASGMHRACALARDYAGRRVAFGRPLAELPLHAATLADMEAEAAAALALVMECAALLGRVEAGTATDDQRRRLRALIPLAKLTTAKQAVALRLGGARVLRRRRLRRGHRAAEAAARRPGAADLGGHHQRAVARPAARGGQGRPGSRRCSRT